MKRVELELEMLTPTFLSGNNQTKPEWRAPSVRGQLRWWLRALAASDIADPEERIKKVRELETAVFGSTQRRSPVTVRARKLRTGRAQKQYKSIKYLAYGCLNSRSGKPDRAVFHPGTKVSVTLQWRSRELGEESEDLLWKSVWCWLALGGIGSKSRKGFGSLTLVGDIPESLEDLKFDSPGDFHRALAKRLGEGGQAPDPPEWSHVSPKARVLVSKQSTRSGVDALRKAASWLSDLRSGYGARHDTRTLDGMPLRKRDVSWVKHALPTYHEQAPDRAGFGLPLPFHSPDDTIRDKETVTWDGDQGVPRRASPLHLHVGRFGGRYRTVWTYIPARLIPEGHKLTFANDSGSTYEVSDAQREIVDRTLNHFVQSDELEEIWP